jgi:hypothetical protein
MAEASQFSRAFVMGLVGAAIASLGFFALSRASGEIGHGARNAMSDYFRGRSSIAEIVKTETRSSRSTARIFPLRNEEAPIATNNQTTRRPSAFAAEADEAKSAAKKASSGSSDGV